MAESDIDSIIDEIKDIKTELSDKRKEHARFVRRAEQVAARHAKLNQEVEAMRAQIEAANAELAGPEMTAVHNALEAGENVTEAQYERYENLWRVVESEAKFSRREDAVIQAESQIEDAKLEIQGADEEIADFLEKIAGLEKDRALKAQRLKQVKARLAWLEKKAEAMEIDTDAADAAMEELNGEEMTAVFNYLESLPAN